MLLSNSSATQQKSGSVESFKVRARTNPNLI